MRYPKYLLHFSCLILLLMAFVISWIPLAAAENLENPTIQIEKKARLAVFVVKKGEEKEIGRFKDADDPLLIDKKNGMTLIYGNPKDPDVIEKINTPIVYCYTITNHGDQSVLIRSFIDDNGTNKDPKDDIHLTPKLAEILGPEMLLSSGKSVTLESDVIKLDFTEWCEKNSRATLSAFNGISEIKASDSAKIMRNIAIFECPPDASASNKDDAAPMKTGAATLHSNCCGQASISYNDDSMTIGNAKEIITRTWTIEIICKDLPSPFFAECAQTIQINP